MLIISETLCYKVMSSQPTGKENYTQACLLNGITKIEHATFICLVTFPMYSANFNMMPQSIRNTHRPNMSRRCMQQKKYAMQDDTPPLMAKQCLNIQKVTGSVLYYARAVNPTVFMPINDISMEQKNPRREPKPQQINYWIIWQLTQMPPSGIMSKT
jgi:hypothetical protein